MRLKRSGADWRRWGPYVSARAWGTVREDYSATGAAWDFLPHDHARSKAYRWNEDGLAAISDDQQRICFGLALWNGQDAILKERPFGLSGPEGNHGEDVKEYYFFQDNLPSHAYMKMLYKYPQAAFPYEDLVKTNAARTRHEPEYELLDTNVFADDKYWDVTAEYAKASEGDVLIQITLANRGPEEATLEVLPTLWYRNVWAWGWKSPKNARPEMKKGLGPVTCIQADHAEMGPHFLLCQDTPELLFTENETNCRRLYGTDSPAPYVKDGINEYVVNGIQGAVNPAQTGTKASARYRVTVGAGQQTTLRLRLTDQVLAPDPLGAGFAQVFAARLAEADLFHNSIGSAELSADARLVMRQAFAGLLWSKQFYKYDVVHWLDGDPDQPAPPEARLGGRNHEWRHLNAKDIISMPDTWEYPWFAAWDLAFHCIPLAVIDPQFAKDQLLLLGHEWYQHPNGQLPAYEWAFGDVNPPVQAWAALRVYQIEARVLEKDGDFLFLEKMFHKLLMNFTWWVNRKDAEGKNVFQGGFLGLDNIGLFDRSQPLPTGGYLEQSDGTSWMAMFCLNMLSIALELTRRDPSYEDMATKFFEHFIYIAHAMNTMGLVRRRAVRRPGRLLLRRPAPPRRPQRVPPRPVARRPDPPARRGHHGRTPVRRPGRLPAAHRVVPRQPPEPRARTSPISARPATTAAASSPSSAPTACAPSSPACSTRPSSCPPTACAPFPAPTSTTPSSWTSTASSTAWTTSRPSPPRACSAATPTGAAPSGSPSTICSSRPSRSTTTTSAPPSPSRSPPGPASP